MSDSGQPHRWQPTRLRHPWDSPGKNTGVGCPVLLQCVKVKSESEVIQSCPTLNDPMDWSPPGSSVHGIFQARVVEWVAIAFSKICLGWSILESVLFSARTNSSIILIRTKSCYHFFLLWYTLVKILEYWLKLWILTRFCSVWCRTGIIELFNQFHNLCKHWKKFNSSKLWTSNVSLSVLVLGHPYQRASLSSHNQEKTELESFRISMERIWASETPSGHKNYALFLFS